MIARELGLKALAGAWLTAGWGLSASLLVGACDRPARRTLQDRVCDTRVVYAADAQRLGD